MFENVLTDIINDLPFRIPDVFLKEKDFHYGPGFPQRGRWTTDPPDFKWRCDINDEFTAKWLSSTDRPVGLPDIPVEGYTGGREIRKHRINLKGRTIQVIVKLANIHLVRQL